MARLRAWKGPLQSKRAPFRMTASSPSVAPESRLARTRRLRRSETLRRSFSGSAPNSKPSFRMAMSKRVSTVRRFPLPLCGAYERPVPVGRRRFSSGRGSDGFLPHGLGRRRQRFPLADTLFPKSWGLADQQALAGKSGPATSATRSRSGALGIPNGRSPHSIMWLSAAFRTQTPSKPSGARSSRTGIAVNIAW